MLVETLAILMCSSRFCDASFLSAGRKVFMLCLLIAANTSYCVICRGVFRLLFCFGK